ncbi:AAA family ATPase [Fulvivirgaceae bacterium PWU4]|uniref:AAA family ATPase n=1 Tax=Chryseosolibacter histidini TaxID=2782349 RepID=A0AAP2GJP6_9BACT|nr:AAA family ATPase [Chryseosolibacter histidini]MBT1698244.1 AAA family ATPase [Chryseosolibacter histidini]
MSLTDELRVIESKSSKAKSLIGSCPEMSFAYQTKQEVPALSVNGSICGYRGEVGAFMALPGVGKTCLTNEGLVAAFFASRYSLQNVDCFDIKYNSVGRKCLLGDTERTEGDCSKTYNNLFKRLGSPTSILSDDHQHIKDLTHLVMAEIGDVKKLRMTLEEYVGTGEYELVILDGILDFTISMLDDKDAMKVIKWIRALAVKYNCLIVTTIHPNKGTDSPAGHVGAFLYRWCRFLLLLRSTSDKNIKEVTADFPFAKLSHANIAEFEPIYFSWNPSAGMMTTCQAPAPPTYKINFLKQAVMELRLNHNQIPSAVLKEKYCHLAGVKPETAKKHILKAVEDGLLIQSGEGKATCYLPASDWNLSSTSHSGIDAPYIYKGAIPESESQDAKSPNDTRINGKGYPNDWD